MAGQWLAGETIAERYDRVGASTSGFDYMRIGLAVCVVLQHSVIVTDQEAAVVLWTTWPRSLFGLILPAFFALSGFLVSASLLKRPTVAAFVSMRVLRLVPALAVEIFLSAIVLGGLLTEVPWSTYFSSSEFWAYFLNIVGDIQYTLPGVFAHNEYADMVNVSLFTIPYELECYIILIFLYFIGFVKHRNWLLIVVALMVALGSILITLRYHPIYEASPPSGRSLVVAFMVGVALQLFSNRVRLNGWLCLASLVVGSLLIRRVELTFIAMVPIAYATIYLGMLNPKRLKILLSGDYSYGLYLFAFPLQQTAAMLFPAWRWWGYNFCFSLPLGLFYAALSWWLIERPILARKREVATFADRMTEWVRRRVHFRKAG